jgi:hypothetical protein
MNKIVMSICRVVRRLRIRKLSSRLKHPDVKKQDQAIHELHSLLLLGKVSITKDIVESLQPIFYDPRSWVRWNAASVLLDLGKRGERDAPTWMRSVLVDEGGEIRMDKDFQYE